LHLDSLCQGFARRQLLSTMIKGLSVLAALFLCQRAWAQCAVGQTGPTCKNGNAPSASRPPCPDGPAQCCTGAVCSDRPRPGGAGGPPAGGGAGPGGASGCSNPTCASPPCAAGGARGFGDVGCTTVAGIETIKHEMKAKGDTIAAGSHIFGPFEAGFGVRQKSIIEAWGCTDPTVAYDSAGGLDIDIAEKKVSRLCGVKLPRIVNDRYIGIVGLCGGHTMDYHFHLRFACLYSAKGAHSSKIGVLAQWSLYGKWEDFANKKLPLLDACGAHFGITPDSAGKEVYHYHAQDKPPFSVGCYGPSADNKLVSVAACRKLYPTSCTNKTEDIKIRNDKGQDVTVKYERFCPCWDAKGLNVGAITELPALSSSTNFVTASAQESAGGGDVTTAPVTSAPTGAPAKAPTSTTSTTHTLKATELKGSLTMTVPDAAQFKDDTVAQNAVKDGIAHVAGVPASYITLTVSISRRLASKGMGSFSQRDRRLVGSVVVSYTITIPVGATMNASTAVANLDKTTPEVFTIKISEKVKVAKGDDYRVTVTAKPNVTTKEVLVMQKPTRTTVVPSTSQAYMHGAMALFFISFHLQQ